MTKTTLWIIGTFVIAFLTYLLSPSFDSLFNYFGFWEVRNQLVIFTGVLAFTFMTLVMILSVRPKWLDFATGGLDKAYGLHKWAGIFVTITLVIHWLAEKLPAWLVGWGVMAHPGHLARGATPSASQMMWVESGVQVAEWTFYLFIILVVIALFNKIPYHWFRYAHKVFPVIFIASVYHGVTVLFKVEWLGTFSGYAIIALASIGSIASLFALSQRIGASRTVSATITQIDHYDNGIVDIRLDIPAGFTHRAGQFAFVSFEHDKEPHPFTIASSGEDPHTIRFSIKALGDFTNNLAGSLKPGQSVAIEGPYGQFRFDIAGTRQVWVAGGIGITPFMARLESLANNKKAACPIDLWYCVSREQDAAFPDALETLCNQAGVTLHYVNAAQQQYLNAKMIHETISSFNGVNIWFCGPQGFAQSLRKGLNTFGVTDSAFHREQFSMR